MRNIITAVICALALCVLTSACGLHLRGMQQEERSRAQKYTSISLKGSPSSRLYQILYSKLSALGVPMVEKPVPGTIIISFSGPTIKNSLAAVDSRSQEVEYSLTSKTIYSFVMFGDKKKPVRYVAGFTRGLFNKNNEVLASANESEFIRDELIQQTAEDIFTRFLRN